MGQSHLHLDDSAVQAGRRSATLTLADGSAHTLWFQADGIVLRTQSGADPFLLGIWLLVMKRGGGLHVHGSVSRRLLAGLTEFQDAWMRWRPAAYSAVLVTADEVRDDSVRNPKAVVAFSGGVDASFTFRRHVTGDAGWRSADIRAAILVHGFDIPLRENAMFDNARIRAAAMLQGSGVGLMTIRTNVRELHQKWYDVFGLAVASCFALVSPEYGIGLIGSSESYDTMDFPGGSNPITDPLTSTGEMEVRHDGAGTSRTEKVAYLASWAHGLPLLRVCWQAGVRDGNCGHCEKCARTKLNFRVAGIESPPCFPVPDGQQKRIWLKGASQVSGWDSIRRQAEAAGRSDVAASANKVIRRSRPMVFVYRHPRLQAVARRVRVTLELLRPPSNPSTWRPRR